MKIVVLNEVFLKDSHIKRLKSLGEVEIYSDTNTEEQVIERLKGVDIAVGDMFVAPLNAKVFGSLDKLKLMVLNTIGIELVDVEAASKKGIKVADIPGFCMESVAEQVIALMFAVNRKIVIGDKEMRSKPFETDPGAEAHKKYCGFDIAGKTVGVIGLGSIGQRVAKLAMGLGMKVIAYNRSKKRIEWIEEVSLEELFKNAEVISLNLPYAPELEGLISRELLKSMKKNAIFINTTRGILVDETALYEVLKNRQIGGAGLDVVSDWSKDNLLLTLDNVVFSPHSAWYTKESLKNMAEMVVENVEAFIKGNPKNIVN